MVEIRRLTVPADAVTERRLYERALVVYEQFPEIAFRVQVLTRRCVEDARAGGGAQLLELKTFRMRGHAPHDAAEYVPRELFEEWARKDPIERFERALGLSPEERRAVEERVRKEVDDAVEFAEDSPWPEGPEALRGVFEDDSLVRFTPWWER